MNEFDIIKNYFVKSIADSPHVLCGIGDDAAIVSVPNGESLVITTDTLIEGVHFPLSTLPADVGYKSLAVNLSDLAAMGAKPAWMTLALTLPNKNPTWLADFCHDFFELAKAHHTLLIGGDLTRGNLSITVSLLGFVKMDYALLRANAKPNDLIYVTGTLGDAGLALKFLNEKVKLNKDDQSFVLKRLNRPESRVNVGQALHHLANAAIDISDGLAADLTHILNASRVGAKIYVDKIPLSTALKNSLTADKAITLALTAGDDFELCFTVPQEKQAELEQKLASICPCTCIGVIQEEPGLDLCYQDGSKYHGAISGYQHF